MTRPLPRRRFDSYPFAPRVGAIPWDAYEHRPTVGPVPVSEPRNMRCACGGWIRFPRHPTETEISRSIREHQDTPYHREWAER